MAGQPITRKAIEHLKDIGIESLDQRLLEALSEGYSFNQIIKGKCPLLKDFTRPGKDSLTWFIFYKYLDLPRASSNSNFKEEVMRVREQAQKEIAHKTLEEAIEIADNVDLDSDSINKAKLQIDTRKWKAGSYNSQFKAGNSTDVKVNISTQDLHLEALKINK
jgi:hypothetical protein